MSSDIPSAYDLKQAVRVGQRITPEDVSAISKTEGGPVAGSSAG